MRGWRPLTRGKPARGSLGLGDEFIGFAGGWGCKVETREEDRRAGAGARCPDACRIEPGREN